MQPYISPISPLHLPYISPTSPLHLPKVLDGAGIESAEQAVAKERYAGRLTVDALVEKVGHNFWEHVRELDLSRSKIRELEGLQGAEFVNLRELNLDSNLLRSSPPYLPHISPVSPLYLGANMAEAMNRAKVPEPYPKPKP